MTLHSTSSTPATASPPAATRWPRLPKRFTPVVFAFYMAGIMAFLMCIVITLVNGGWGPDLATRVWRAYLVAMPTAFVCVLAVRPLVMRLVSWTVQA